MAVASVLIQSAPSGTWVVGTNTGHDVVRAAMPTDAVPQQAYSYDNRTWETNWTAGFTRADSREYREQNGIGHIGQTRSSH